MKIGVFDSGLGGLVIAKSIRAHTPDIDMVYFGDTLHLPYGNRSSEAIYEYSRRGIEFLFKEGCSLIVVACNTVSASALRKIQQQYLPNSPYKNRRVLGVVVPTLESAIDVGYKRLGLIATNYTIESNIYREELQKIEPSIEILQKNTPLLVPLIENDGDLWMTSVLEHYLSSLIEEGIECLILGCTHYSFLKNKIKMVLGVDISILSQDEIIPLKLIDYLDRHPEISNTLTRLGESEFVVSDVTQGYISAAHKIYGEVIPVGEVTLSLEDNTYSRKSA